MNDAQLLRYSRHILLDAIGIEGQQRLLDAHVLVIGAGGLGSPVLLYLGSAGVGHITVVDHDTVDATNLQRQVAHTQARVGLPKVESVALAIAAINADVRVTAIQQRADEASLAQWVADADVVIDCSDNYDTRQAVNAACVQQRKPLVSGAAIGFDGQISVWDSRTPQAPCYACVFPPDATVEEVHCATMGVFAPLVGIIGTMQAAEALKLLIGCGDALAGRLQMLDGMNMEWTEVRVAREGACPVCSAYRSPALPV
jgi:molybdopterin/thiamine biosynthesis adenylyltransferase